MNIEHVTSTALVFSVSRSVGKECSIFHKDTAQINGNKIMSIIPCTLSLLILESCSMCIRGSRSLQKFELVDDFTTAYDFYKC